ncbi:MAG TPA: 50S ribosomal protein L23 [Candidatus Peribacterales bacterium]|nr:50S ribosomal protein L23 [Candidatus Peribacterales bacterium]
MNLTTVILGSVVTEKAERLKIGRTYVLRIHADATKVDVKNALRIHYGVEPIKVRILKVVPKRRMIGRGKFIEKREAERRALVTLTEKSKALDLTSITS